MIKPLTDQEEPTFTIFVESSQLELEWSAVLESQNIPFEIQNNPDSDTSLFILDPDNYSAAIENIDAYEKERPFFEKFRTLFTASPAPLRLKYGIPSFIISILLSLFYYISGSAANQSEFQLKGMLSHKFFSESFWWCPVTALTLHADVPHLASNLAFFMIFGTAAAIQAGAGSTILFVILSGILANLSTLTVFGDKVYNAIGFSTSVFGVLGILATVRLMRNIKSKKIFSFYFWVPMIAAVAILGLMGGSAGSDLAGHFFGFMWGAACGIPLFLLSKFRKNITLQTILYFITLAILALSWYVALTAKG